MTPAQDRFETSTIQRTESGAVDTEYYRDQARRLRAEVLREATQRIIARVASCLHQPIHCLRQWRQRRAQRRQLAQLSARELRDIGIGRNDIEAIASGDFFTDTTRRRQPRRHADSGKQP